MTTQTQSEARTPSPRLAHSTPAAPPVAPENTTNPTPPAAESPQVNRLLDALSVTRRIRRMTAIGRGRPKHAVEPAERATAYVVERAAEGCNAWISTSEFDSSGNGGAEHVVGVNALTFDFDDKCADRAAVEALIPIVEELLGVKFRALVDSGHGLQPHAAIDDVRARWAPEDATTRQRWQGAFRDIHRAVRQVAAERGLMLDTTDGTERLWRAPGTTNTKPGMPPVAATLISVNPDSDALTLLDIEAAARRVLDAAEPAPAVEPPARTTGGQGDREDVAAYQARALAGIVAETRALADLAEGQTDARGKGWTVGIQHAFWRAGRLVGMAGGSLTERAAGEALLPACPTGGSIDRDWLRAQWRLQFDKGRDNPEILPTLEAGTRSREVRRAADGGQVERATADEPMSVLEAREQYPVLGARPVLHMGFLFEEIVYLDDKGRPQKKLGKFLPSTTAKYLDDKLANGRDGSIYAFRNGVFESDQDEVLRRVAWALRNEYLPGRHRAVADIMSVMQRPVLPDEPDQRYINMPNGMYEIATGQLLPHSPNFLSQVQVATPFDPEATCPNTDAWLREVFPADSLELAWDVIAYLLLPGNPLQVAILEHGPGRNGKGTLNRLVRHIVGGRNVSSISLESIAEGKFEIANLYGKQINIAGEVDARYLKSTAMLKAITGGDTIQAQHKHQRPFEFTPWATPIFSANELWRSSDTSEGYIRRWVALPMPNILSADGAFDERLLHAEAPGVVAKALPRLPQLLERGKFELSASSRELLSAFRQQGDSVLTWLAEDDWISTHEPTTTTSWSQRTKLHHRYRTWAIESGHGAMSSTRFYRRLRDLGYQESARRGVDGFIGLALLEGLAR